MLKRRTTLSTRVEVTTPVITREHREKLWELLTICLADRRQAWVLDSSGAYTQLRPDENSEGAEALGTHQAMMNLMRVRVGA